MRNFTLSSFLGHARLLAIKCVKEGMNVFVACRNQEALKFLESSAINGSGSIDAFVMDPTKDASVLELKQKIEDKLIAKEKGVKFNILKNIHLAIVFTHI
jgi:short-subunit dehydrogenase